MGRSFFTRLELRLNPATSAILAQTPSKFNNVISVDLPCHTNTFHFHFRFTSTFVVHRTRVVY